MAVVLVYLSSTGTEVQAQPLNLDALYKSIALQHHDDWRLLKAISMKESSENPLAVNPSDPSYGLMGIQSFWLVHFGFIDKKATDKEAKAAAILKDPAVSIDTCCRILEYFRGRTNPATLHPFRFPEEADIYNVGETLWTKGVRNVPYRDFILNQYRKLSAL